MKLNHLTIEELHDKLVKKETTSVEATKACLDQIKALNPKINSFITVCEEEALKKAKQADEQIAKNENITMLTGIPIAIKDNIVTKGIRTSCASNILENFVPIYNATVIEKLENAGAVLLGKANLDEFAMGSSNENSAFKPVKNPWNLERIPGGSSGGPTASVAADMAIASLGSDTGGSIRLPASFCGVTGLKPTYGSISRFGLVAFGSSLDQIGPITKSVADNAILFSVLAGKDNKDSTSIEYPVADFYKKLNKDDNYLKGLKVGIPKEYLGIDGIDKEVKQKIEDAIKVFSDNGAIIEEISLPHTEFGVAVYYIICTAEASSNLARYDGVKYGLREKSNELADMYHDTRSKGFGDEVKRRIMLGTFALSSGYYDAYYRKASQVRALIKKDFEDAFKKVDIILTPTAPEVAWKLGEKLDDPLKMYLSDIYTINVNLAGIPSMAMPCGFSKDNMPIGMQLMAKNLDEEKIFKAGFSYQNITSWHKEKPKL